MKKKELITGRVEYSEFPNVGVIKAEDETIKVKNVVPGQKVTVRLSKKRSTLWRGDLTEVLEEPEESIETDCPHYGLCPSTAEGEHSCGSCLYRNISYERELEIKSDQLRRLFCPILDFDEVFEGTDPSPVTVGYRNKMEFSFGDAFQGGPLELGLHRRGSFYDIADCGGCRLIHPDMDMVRKATLDFFRDRGLSYFHKREHIGYLRHLLVRRSATTGEILVDLITAGRELFSEKEEGLDEKGLLSDYADMLSGLSLEGSIAGVLHTTNNRLGDVVVDEGTEILFGKDYIDESVLGLEFKITPFSFFQTNTKGAEVLYDRVRSLIRNLVGEFGGKAPVIYDLYSGTGTIAQLVAPVASEVVGVEIIPEAVKAAEENAALNGLSNCSFNCGDVLQVVDELSTKPDIIILDPPRDGIHPKALPKILAFGVKHIIYISCKASSLARDLPEFMEAGYEVRSMFATEMYPRTSNIETCVCLTKSA